MYTAGACAVAMGPLHLPWPRKPSFTREELNQVLAMLDLDRPIATIARDTRLTRQAVYRIKANPVQAEATLTAWEAG